MKIHKLSAYGLGAFVLTFGATLAFGQARVPYTRPPYIVTPGNITATGNVSGANVSVPYNGKVCVDGATCNSFWKQSGATSGMEMRYNNSLLWDVGGTLLPYWYRPLTTASYFNSGAASGASAYQCANVGCRLSLGNTGRYLYDTGSTLASIGGLSADTFTATTATGSALTGGGASGTLLITSNTPDSVTSVNGPATITMQATQALTAGDQVFRVLTSDGTQVFAVRSNANIAVGGSTGQGTLNFATYNSQQNIAQIVNDAALTEKNPVRIVHVKDVTADDASLLSIYKNLTTRVMTVSKDGLVRVNASNAAKPTCNADNRGRVFYLDGAAGVADTYEICMKDASDVYAWKTIVTP